MYEILSDGAVVYSPALLEEGYAVIEPKLTKELNRAGSLEFSLPPDNPMYNSLRKLSSIVTVRQNGEEIWRGRVLSEETDFYRVKKIVCEGELAFLNDTVVEPYDFSGGISLSQFFSYILSSYSGHCSAARRIVAGRIEGVGGGTILYDYSDSYTVTLDTLLDKFVEQAGGYLRIRREGGVSYLDYLDVYSTPCNQSIEFGNNLLDLTQFIDASEVYTALIPLGKTDEEGHPLTVAPVNGGNSCIVNQTAAALFGFIVRSADFGEIESPSQLYQEGVKVLNKAVEAATTITVKALDLYLLGAQTDRLDVGSLVNVISAPHGIDTQFLCSGAEIDLVNPENSTYTFGLAKTSLTEKNFAINRKERQSLADAKSDLEDEISESLENSKEYTNKKWHEVTTGQEEFKVEYGQKVTEIEDKIKTVTEDVSTLTVRADEIATSVSQTKTELEGDIEKSKTDMRSEFSQTASQIYSRVSSVETKADSANSTANEAYSEAVQTANKLSWVVSGGSSSSSMTINPNFVSIVSQQVEVSSGISDIKLLISGNSHGVYVAQSAGTLYLGSSGSYTYCKGNLSCGYLVCDGQIRGMGNLVIDGQLAAYSAIFTGKCQASEWETQSDRRLKKDIQNLSEEESAAFIYRLNPVQYRYISGGRDTEYFGFIAQEVEEALTAAGYGTHQGAILSEDEDGFLALDYTKFTAPLIKTVQALERRVAALEAKLAAQEGR